MEEEVVLLEEQLAAAHADIERLQSQLAELAASESRREAETQALRVGLEASRRESEAANSANAAQAAEAARLQETLTETQLQAREALARYRDAVLQREPQLPADLVSGANVAELDASIDRARQTVARVRQHLEQQAQAARVPSGAPVRGAPDTSDMSAAEKIRLGLQKA
jgi:hypothetical protein